MNTILSRKTWILSSTAIVLSLAMGWYVYPTLPETVASHWDGNGQANGYLDKFWGVFLMPLISIVLLIVLAVLPNIDPLKKNVEAFRISYNEFVLLMVVFMSYLNMATLAWNVGFDFNMTYAVVPALSALCIFLGRLLRSSKRNWFIGIRTPWTLSSDDVWDATHVLAGRLFGVAGLVILTSFFFPPDILLRIVLIAILTAVGIPVVYSYFEYQKYR